MPLQSDPYGRPTTGGGFGRGNGGFVTQRRMPAAPAAQTTNVIPTPIGFERRDDGKLYATQEALNALRGRVNSMGPYYGVSRLGDYFVDLNTGSFQSSAGNSPVVELRPPGPRRMPATEEQLASAFRRRNNRGPNFPRQGGRIQNGGANIITGNAFLDTQANAQAQVDAQREALMRQAQGNPAVGSIMSPERARSWRAEMEARKAMDVIGSQAQDALRRQQMIEARIAELMRQAMLREALGQ